MWASAKRWLYRGGRPGALASALNRAFGALHAAGGGPASWATLEVVGRKSGRTISFPVVIAAGENGDRFLVSMLGTEAAWVRNVEAAGGRVVLRRGRAEPARLELVPIADRAPILKAYLRVAPGARPHVPVSKDAPLADFASIAAMFPVYRVVAPP
jgi:hypothetical protein